MARRSFPGTEISRHDSEDIHRLQGSSILNPEREAQMSVQRDTIYRNSEGGLEFYDPATGVHQYLEDEPYTPESGRTQSAWNHMARYLRADHRTAPSAAARGRDRGAATRKLS